MPNTLSPEQLRALQQWMQQHGRDTSGGAMTMGGDIYLPQYQTTRNGADQETTQQSGWVGGAWDPNNYEANHGKPNYFYDLAGNQTGTGSWSSKDTALDKIAPFLPFLLAGGMGALGEIGALSGANAGAGGAAGAGGLAEGAAGFVNPANYEAALGAMGDSAAMGAGGLGAAGAGLAGGAGGAAGALGANSELALGSMGNAAAMGAGAGLLSGAGSLLGPAAALLGAAAGAQGQDASATRKTELPDYLKGPVLDLISRSQGLLNTQMPIAAEQGKQLRTMGQGLLNTPVVGNGFARFQGR